MGEGFWMAFTAVLFGVVGAIAVEIAKELWRRMKK